MKTNLMKGSGEKERVLGKVHATGKSRILIFQKSGPSGAWDKKGEVGGLVLLRALGPARMLSQVLES